MPTMLTGITRSAEPPFKQCKRCFMTGKACIYQRDINDSLKPATGASPATPFGKAFMLMPFKSTLDEVYRAQIDPCLRSIVAEVGRADDVSRTGYVVCEKICRQIQEARLICAEISSDNPNVFYELGLSSALGRNIALFVQSSIKGTRNDVFKKLGLAEEHVNAYTPFEMLDARQIRLWQGHVESPAVSKNDRITILLSDTQSFTEEINGQVFNYTVDGLCRGAIHRALTQLVTPESPWANLLKETIILRDGAYSLDGKDISFMEVEDKVRNSAAVIICTAQEQPASYFWLGFAHGLEKDVVPITALPPRDSKSGITFSAAPARIEQDLPPHDGAMLPFDMRSLWHIYFYCDEPKVLESQVHSILQIVISKDRDIMYRQRFWQPFIDEGKVSIFVGSVELTEKGKRHVVGEWDYRTVSELTSFFAKTKETMETVIQTPTFQASTLLLSNDPTKDSIGAPEYVKELTKKLTSGNSVVVASADVNDMTEVALSTLAAVEPFNSAQRTQSWFHGVVAFKDSEYAAFTTPSLYFHAENSQGVKGRRGFYDIQGGNTHTDRTYDSDYVAHDKSTPDLYTKYYGHIARFQIPGSIHWTVVLQGITGPATLGVAQVATGGVHEQFTIFDPSIPSDSRMKVLKSVSMKSSSLGELMRSTDGQVTIAHMRRHAEDLCKKIEEAARDGRSVETIVVIYVMDGNVSHHDERRIVWWDTVKDHPRAMAVPGRRNTG